MKEVAIMKKGASRQVDNYPRRSLVNDIKFDFHRMIRICTSRLDALARTRRVLAAFEIELLPYYLRTRVEAMPTRSSDSW